MIEVSNFVLNRTIDTLKIVYELYTYDDTILDKYFSIISTCVEDTLPHPMELLPDLLFDDLTVFINEKVHDEDDLAFLVPSIDEICQEETISLLNDDFSIRYLEFSSSWIDKYIELDLNSDVPYLTDLILLSNESNNICIGFSQVIFTGYVDNSTEQDMKFKNHLGVLLIDSSPTVQVSLHDSLYLSDSDKTTQINQLLELTKDMQPIEH